MARCMRSTTRRIVSNTPLAGLQVLVFLKRKGDWLEIQSPTTQRFPGGRTLDLWIGNIACANSDVPRPERSWRGDPRHGRSEQVRRQCTGKTRSGSSLTFLARRHRSRIEAKSRSVAFEC